MSLFFVAKNVYGQMMYYPACEKSKEFLTALGLKTFTKDAIRAIKALGYELVQSTETVKL